MPQSIYPLEHSPLINYSIIIPHYNTPDLLMRCLASIPVREDVQVIVVDDNSPEADTYLERYPELSRPYLEFVATKKGGGAGYARNVGIDRAKGKWLIFADADDFFSDDLSLILDKCQNRTAEIIYFRCRSVLSEDITQSCTNADSINSLIDNYFHHGDEDTLKLRHWVPWGKLYSRELIIHNYLRFEEIPFSNDIGFCSKAACCVYSPILVEDSILYVYCVNSTSLSNTNSFCSKKGELEIRSLACFRYHKTIHEAGYTLTGRYPISDFLAILFLRNRKLFESIFLQLSDIGCSRWTVLRQIRGWQRSIINKLILYPYALFVLIKNVFNGKTIEG